MKTTATAVRLNTDLYEHLKERCAKSGTPLPDLLGELVQAGVECERTHKNKRGKK